MLYKLRLLDLLVIPNNVWFTTPLYFTTYVHHVFMFLLVSLRAAPIVPYFYVLYLSNHLLLKLARSFFMFHTVFCFFF